MRRKQTKIPTEPQRQRGINIHDSLWDKASEKAGALSVSAIIRTLLKKWVNGEIELKFEEIK